MSANFSEIVQRHIGPPVQIEKIIRDLGIALDKNADLHADIAGQLERLPSGGFKISVNKSDSYYRKRFTMAHELGHYLLHAHLIGDGVDDSKAYRSVPDGNFSNGSIDAREETQANQFAASLLLPQGTIKTLATVGTSVREISMKLQASLPATKIRLKTLGYGINDSSDAIVSVP